MRDSESLPPDIDHAVIDRYLAGEASAAERARIALWMDRSLEARMLIGALREPGAFDDARRDGVVFDVPTVRRRVDAAVAGAPDRDPHPRRRDRVERKSGRPFVLRPLVSWMWGVTATVAVLAVGGILVARGGRGGRAESFQPRTYATRTGERAVLALDDGTRVTLAPQTTLRILAFGERARTVALDGEAYFAVTRAGGAPFVVQTGRISTRVLGTTFWVRHYASDAHVHVAVTTGKVAVTAQTPQRPNITLAAGTVGDVTDSSAITMAAGDISQYGSWVHGRLVFRDAPMRDVLTTLERWYGYHFQLADPTLAGESVTAVLSTESAARAFATLELLLDVDLRFDGQVVTLTPRRSRQTRVRRPSLELFTTHTSEVGR